MRFVLCRNKETGEIVGIYTCSNDRLISLPDDFGELTIGGDFDFHDYEIIELPEMLTVEGAE